MLGLNREREILSLKRNAREVVESVMNLKEEEKIKCCYALWMCWYERNRVREGELRRDACWLFHSVQTQIEQWKKTAVSREPPARRPPCSWEKPNVGRLKVKCDAA